MLWMMERNGHIGIWLVVCSESEIRKNKTVGSGGWPVFVSLAGEPMSLSSPSFPYFYFCVNSSSSLAPVPFPQNYHVVFSYMSRWTSVPFTLLPSYLYLFFSKLLSSVPTFQQTLLLSLSSLTNRAACHSISATIFLLNPPPTMSATSSSTSLWSKSHPHSTMRKQGKPPTCALQTPSLQHFQSPSVYTATPAVVPKTKQSPSTNTQAGAPQWNIFQKAASVALDAFENALVNTERRHPLPKTADPSVQIAGNYGPVPEQPACPNLPVTGQIPDCIQGVYVRNGANPLFEPVAGHHLFDGDGMVHAVNIQDGTASYACRFTETQRLVQEKAFGRPVFPKAIGELHGHTGIARLMLFYARGLCGLVDHTQGTGVANAGLVYFNNRLLAMSEDDLPYQVRVNPNTGDLQTVGRYDFNGQLNSAMIAHPKLDPHTGQLFALSYDVVQKPYLKYFSFSPDGTKSPDVEIPLAEPTMMHDFAITQQYVVIPDQQVVFKLQEMIRGGSPVVYDKNKPARFGVLAKDAQDATGIKWVEVPDCFCFHLWNAWEEPETNEVVVIGSCMTPADSIFNECDEGLESVLSEIRLNLTTGVSTRRPIISDESKQINLEAGMVNQKQLGRKTRYSYHAIAEPWPKVSGIAKVDLSTGDVHKFIYGDGCYGGEPYFVPSSSSSGSGEEDDGYILAFMHNEKKSKSELLIINSKNLQLEASVKLPSRVPYGFHGTFIPAKQLGKQA